MNKVTYYLFVIALLFLGAFPTLITAQEEPELLLFERNPWLMIIGSDSPVFAHYSSGITIYWDESEDKGLYKIVKLETKEKKDLLRKLKSLHGLKKNYSTTDWSDQTTAELHFKKEEEMKVISVYGPIKESAKARKKAPNEFLIIFDYLVSFKHPEATKWAPKFFEVMVWPYEYAPDKSIVWPSSWPDTKSESTKTRGDSFSIFLPYVQKDEFFRFIKTRNKRGAVLINGKKWAVAARIPFPHEIPVNKPLKQIP